MMDYKKLQSRLGKTHAVSRVLDLGDISLRKLLPTCATPIGSLPRIVLKRRGKSTNIDWHVSGRRYAASPSGPIPTWNIMLNLRTRPSSPLHFGHAILFFATLHKLHRWILLRDIKLLPYSQKIFPPWHS